MTAQFLANKFKGLALLGLATIAIGSISGPKHEDSHVSARHRSVYECNVNHLPPALAKAFVSWWIQTSLDYSKNTGIESHTAASGWMPTEIAKKFNRVFWSIQGLGNVEFVPTYVWPPVPKNDSTVDVGVSFIWINKTDLSSRIGKVTFEVGTVPMGLRITKFNIDNDPKGLTTSKFLSKINPISGEYAPSNERAIAELKKGIAAHIERRSAAAIEHYNAVLALMPNFALAYDLRGHARYDVGDKKGAMKDETQATILDQWTADARAQLKADLEH